MAASRSFYLYRRGEIFYAEILNSRGVRVVARSTGKTSRDEAAAEVGQWLREGIPDRARKTRPVAVILELAGILETIRKSPLDTAGAEAIVLALKDRGLIVGNFTKVGPSSVKFLDFLEDSWNPEKSKWIKEKASYGHGLTKRHITESIGIIKRYWLRGNFLDVLLIDVTRNMLKDHLVYLRGQSLSAATVNKALATISAPLAWAEKEQIISENPAAGIPHFTGGAKERGILSTAEIKALVCLEWSDPRPRAAFLVALTCGLRLSEVQALRAQDIQAGRLLVRNSWSWADKMTCLKNKESREVRILPEVRDALTDLLEGNPHKAGEDDFVFFGLKPDQPLDTKVLTDGYRMALEAIGIDQDQRKARNLVYHGLRHNFVVALSDRVSESSAMKSTGHKSSAMFKHYAAHSTEESLAAVGEAVDDAFGKVLKFTKKGA